MFLVLCRPYHTLLFLLEKDICDVPCAVQALPHAAVPDGEGYIMFLVLCRPYHTLLFLVDEKDILDSLSTDASPALRRLVRHSSPLKSFRTLGRGTLNLKVTDDSAKLKIIYSRFLLATVMRIRVREPEFGAFLTSGSGSGMRKNSNQFSESLETVFWV
jgi:hypothetical protein